MNDRQLNILLVGDDEAEIMIVQHAFRKNNVANPFFVAANGVEALAMLRGISGAGNVPDKRRIILLDLGMPETGAIEFLRELQSDHALRHITVLALVTGDEQHSEVDARNLNVAGYIRKPLTLEAFVEITASLNKYWTVCELP